MSQINFKLAISNIYKVCLIPIMFKSGVLKDLLSHDCIMDPSGRLLVTGKDSTQINQNPGSYEIAKVALQFWPV